MKTIILGAGFAGRYAARVLNSLAGGHDVTLIDKHSYTTMVPILPDYAGGRFSRSLITREIAEVLPPRIGYVQDDITTLDLDEKRLEGRYSHYTFDKLIIACGSKTAFHGFEPQSWDDVYTLDSVPAADRIRNEFPYYLQKKGNEAHAVVVGGGYTGMELACALTHMARAQGYDCTVSVVELMDTILPFFNEEQRRSIQQHFEKLGIRLMTRSKISEYRDGMVRINDSETIKEPFFCWTAGLDFSVPEVNASKAERLKDGRFHVHHDLSVIHYPDVYAAGDAAAVFAKGSYIRKAVNYSVYSGKKAGKNCMRAVMGYSHVAFTPFDLGWVIPLCTTSAGKLFNRFRIKGKIGLSLHYLMCGLRSFSFSQRLRFLLEALRVWGRRS